MHRCSTQQSDSAIYGIDGTNRLEGGSGNDTIFGGEGDDVILGGPNDDTLWGKDGNDLIWDTEGLNFFHGGLGHDGCPQIIPFLNCERALVTAL